MLSSWRRYTLLGLGLVAALAVALVATTNGAGTRSAQAGLLSEIDCLTIKGGIICISLDPEQDTNAVGEEHAVTTTISVTDLQGIPVPADASLAEVVILVFDGPNAGQSIIDVPNEVGEVSLSYTGDGGVGTDTIATVACLFGKGTITTDAAGKGGGCKTEGFISFCFENTAACMEDFTSPKGACAELPFLICAVAEKEWVGATPTAEPPPTAEPRPDSTAVHTAMTLADVTLPETGAAVQETSATQQTWLAALVGGIAALSAGGAGSLTSGAARRDRP